jgi:hypothetical protein
MATVSILPAKLNYKITRGDDFADEVTIKENGVAVNVSARTYTAQVRLTADTETIVAQMVIDMTSAATGVVGFSIADTVTDDLAGGYVWDFQQDTGGVIRTLMGGSFFVNLDVTRAV